MWPAAADAVHAAVAFCEMTPAATGWLAFIRVGYEAALHAFSFIVLGKLRGIRIR